MGSRDVARDMLCVFCFVFLSRLVFLPNLELPSSIALRFDVFIVSSFHLAARSQ